MFPLPFLLRHPDYGGQVGPQLRFASMFLDRLTSHLSPLTPSPALPSFPAPHKQHTIRRDFSVTLQLLSSQKIKDRFLKNRRLRCTGEV